MPTRLSRPAVAVLGLVLLLAATAVLAATISDPAQAATRTLRISVDRLPAVASGTRVVATARAFDQDAMAIRGVRVRFRWTYNGATRSDLRTTGRKGRTSATRSFTCGAGLYKVTLKVKASWRGQVRFARRSFYVSGGT